jgi:hypothetical protein
MACPFVFAITKPFLHFKMQKGFFTSKNKRSVFGKSLFTAAAKPPL